MPKIYKAVNNARSITIVMTHKEASALADALCYVGGTSERARLLYNLAASLSDAGIEQTILPDEVGVITSTHEVAGVLFD